ncbi:quinoprotein dehydrogenase-associated SoxYZ-like carrier [Paracoccus shanxieyensis]|uniref:Quinoprotein dehydrogenase-associated SoxYZ-like carrier n=1 Tax=Paracoccus shanxieyensis TaxID=2675752 RepID=A0A6L6J0B8_9RHOB|nr:quinoprotein dehydrogenase-associated SoxYZ-like carrier [Paracoccus shanxieyensis]MTH64284.1 quinoprotein dehydrogenase-associated SoxYZ-like carrier [Paracoccus shanxieyensis]MTH87428.1 quinoprotein dehydrogenase-associated SoxYZ-like carrier [Paracoccus shanxieyensis]
MSGLLSHLLPGEDAGLIRPAFGKAAVGGDDFGAGMWPLHLAEYLGDPTHWRHDPGMVVLAPRAAEDSSHVPFLIDATALSGPVQDIVVTIDYSPFAHALTFQPGRALPFLSFGVKYEVAGALRASARIGQGWHVGAAWVSALGGGCSAPATVHARPDWQQGFGQMRARLWPETGRLVVNIRHPQDTGLADGIPAHHLTELELLDTDGARIAHLELHEPLEENPSLTFILPPELAAHPVTIRARDNLADMFTGTVRPDT